MAVRYLAQELYRLTKKVEELEAGLAAMGPGTPAAARHPPGNGTPPGQERAGPFPGHAGSQERETAFIAVSGQLSAFSKDQSGGAPGAP